MQSCYAEQNIDHAMKIVERLEGLGFSYSIRGLSRVCFNDICASGDTLAQEITNAAYSIIEQHSMAESTKMWQKLC